jgi:hypothetical protein
MGVVGADPRVCTSALWPTSETVALLRAQVHQVHLLLDEQVTTTCERAACAPAARREALSMYVHALCVEDITVNFLMRDMPPMFKAVWIGGQLVPWDLTSARSYAQVVYAATEGLFERLTSADLRQEIDLSAEGLGWPTATWVLNHFIVSQMAMTCGELAAIARAASSAANFRPPTLPTQTVASQNGRINGVHRDLPDSNTARNRLQAHDNQTTAEPAARQARRGPS